MWITMWVARERLADRLDTPRLRTPVAARGRVLRRAELDTRELLRRLLVRREVFRA